MAVPVDVTTVKTLYVFVDIGIDTQHFIDTIRKNFEAGKELAIVGTVQFVSSIHVSILHNYPKVDILNALYNSYHTIRLLREYSSKITDLLSRNLNLSLPGKSLGVLRRSWTN